jgi:hypothetical protein
VNLETIIDGVLNQKQQHEDVACFNEYKNEFEQLSTTFNNVFLENVNIDSMAKILESSAMNVVIGKLFILLKASKFTAHEDHIPILNELLGEKKATSMKNTTVLELFQAFGKLEGAEAARITPDIKVKRNQIVSKVIVKILLAYVSKLYKVNFRNLSDEQELQYKHFLDPKVKAKYDDEATETEKQRQQEETEKEEIAKDRRISREKATSQKAKEEEANKPKSKIIPASKYGSV